MSDWVNWANEYSNSLEFDLFTLNWHRNIDLSRIFIHIWFFVPNENGFSFSFYLFRFSLWLFFFFILPRARSPDCAYMQKLKFTSFCLNVPIEERDEAAVIYVLVVWVYAVYIFRFCLMYHFDGCVRFRVCDWICVRTMSTMADSSATLFTISLDYTTYKLQALGRATHMHLFVIVVISEQSEQTVFNIHCNLYNMEMKTNRPTFFPFICFPLSRATHHDITSIWLH